MTWDTFFLVLSLIWAAITIGALIYVLIVV